MRVVRVRSVEPRPVAWTRWRDRVEGIRLVDDVLVTSRSGVAAGVVPWRRHAPTAARSAQYWAVGTTTARALRAAGVRRVRRAATVGASALARAFARQPPRTVLYFRSDRAGPGLARSLRRNGHQVVDLVVYRLETMERLTIRTRRRLAAADLWVATSPSALAAVRSAGGARWFRARLPRTRLVVLGARTRRAAAAFGFERVSVVPTTTTQRFTRHLLNELGDARP